MQRVSNFKDKNSNWKYSPYMPYMQDSGKLAEDTATMTVSPEEHLMWDNVFYTWKRSYTNEIQTIWLDKKDLYYENTSSHGIVNKVILQGPTPR